MDPHKNKKKHTIWIGFNGKDYAQLLVKITLAACFKKHGSLVTMDVLIAVLEQENITLITLKRAVSTSI
jgi:hypothetical protein